MLDIDKSNQMIKKIREKQLEHRASNPVESESFSYEEYKKLVKLNLTNYAALEKYLVWDVIRPYLIKLFINSKDVSIVDVQTNSKRTNIKEKHNKDLYSGKGMPDLLIAKSYDHNKIHEGNEDIEYLAVVEVKSFAEKSELGKLTSQIEDHLSGREITKVIVTDALNWHFFEKSSTTNIGCHVKSFILGNLEGENLFWKNETSKTTDNFLKEELDMESLYEDSEEYNKLEEYIKEFLPNKNKK